MIFHITQTHIPESCPVDDGGFKVTLHPHLINEPYKWKKPRMVFVNSMSDLFHKDIPDEFLKSVFDVMADTPQHTYQILTKRAERLADIANDLPWSDNIWMGVSVENSDYLSRIDLLCTIPAQTRFLSVEPCWDT